mmetsp:Transcript_17954/g.41154  ORF Transcript_17954/g.41154 Transcript_17954/m.41154 type:complete len:134 (+) Transcript_17954:1180-1581(+)
MKCEGRKTKDVNNYQKQIGFTHDATSNDNFKLDSKLTIISLLTSFWSTRFSQHADLGGGNFEVLKTSTPLSHVPYTYSQLECPCFPVMELGGITLETMILTSDLCLPPGNNLTCDFGHHFHDWRRKHSLHRST